MRAIIFTKLFFFLFVVGVFKTIVFAAYYLKKKPHRPRGAWMNSQYGQNGEWVNKLGVTWWKISQASLCSNPQTIPGRARGESPVLFNLPPPFLQIREKLWLVKRTTFLLP